MNRQQRRAAGRDERHVRAKAIAELQSLTPPGWTTEFVVPPWATDRTHGCRACGGTESDGDHWSLMLLVRRRPEKETIFFSFGAVCLDCTRDPGAADRLGVIVFGER